MLSMVEYTAWDIVSLSIIPLILSPIYFWYISGNIHHLIGFAGLIGTSFTIEMIKHFILSDIHRPHGAKGCDLLCLHESDENQPGMPSGHAATMGFYGMYYGITDPLYFIYTLIMVISRYMKKCHNWQQITAGLLFGAIIGHMFTSFKI